MRAAFAYPTFGPSLPLRISFRAPKRLCVLGNTKGQNRFIGKRSRRPAPSSRVCTGPKCSDTSKLTGGLQRQITNATASRAEILKLFSTIVGSFVLLGSLLYKVPQVLRIWRSKSGEGVSLLMYTLETVGTTFSAVYSSRLALPFSTYGESLFIMGQNSLILMLIVIFEKLGKTWALLGGILYIVALFVLYSPAIPLPILTALQISSIPISNLSRLPQIFLNWKRKSTGQLAPTTLGLQLLGNVARIFTTLVRVKNPIILISFLVATLFNSTLVGQWLYYNKYRSRAQPI